MATVQEKFDTKPTPSYARASKALSALLKEGKHPTRKTLAAQLVKQHGQAVDVWTMVAVLQEWRYGLLNKPKLVAVDNLLVDMTRDELLRVRRSVNFELQVRQLQAVRVTKRGAK